MAETEQLIVQLEARISKFEKSFERASRTADQRWKQIESHGKRSSVAIEQSFLRTSATIDRAATVVQRALLRMGTAIGTALSIREIAQAADQWQNFQNKLAGLGVPTEKVADELNRLVETALRTRTELSPIVDLYSKLTLISEQYGLTTEQAHQITETLAKSLKAAGASAGEASSTITQLSQALASGALQGDELRSLRENAPALLKAIAKEIGVTTGALKEMGAEGKLTGDVILRALLKAGTEIDKQFAKTNPTLRDGFTKIQTTFVQLVGEFDRGSGLTRQLAKAFDDAGMSLDDLKGKVHGFGENMADDIEKAVKAATKLYEILSVLGKWSPTGILARWLSGQSLFGGDDGKPANKTPFGPELPPGFVSPIDTSNIKPAAPPSSGGGGKSTDVLESIRERTKALEVEIATFGRSTAEVERARAAHELLSRAESAGIAISDTLKAQIDQASNAYAEQAQRLENLRTAFENLQAARGMAHEFVSGFASDLAHGVSSVEALDNALSRLQDQLIDLAASKVLDFALGSANGGFGGLLGSLFKPGFAEGGLIRGPGSGTSDSIITRVSDGEFVVNAQQSAKYLDVLNAINSGANLKVPAVGGQIAATSVTNNFAPTINVQGGTPEQNADAAERMDRKLREMFREIYSQETVRQFRYGGLFSRN